MSEKIIRIIKSNPKISATEIAKRLGKSSRTIERKIVELRRDKRLERIGPDRGGYWHVINNNDTKD